MSETNDKVSAADGSSHNSVVTVLVQKTGLPNVERKLYYRQYNYQKVERHLSDPDPQRIESFRSTAIGI